MAPRGRARSGDRLPGIARAVVDKAFGMRAAILLDEAAERVNLRSDRHAGDMIAGQRKRRFLRPAFRLGIVDLVKAAIDAVARIAGDHVNFAHAFDHRVLADRNRQARLLDPSARIGRDRGNAGHVTLLLDRRRNAGDVAIEQTGEQRIACCGLRCGCQCHCSPPGVGLVVVERSSDGVGRNRVAQQHAGQFDALARHIVGRARPLLGIGRLVAEITGVALFR